MNTTSRRAAARTLRQQRRRESLTAKDWDDHSEACRLYALFGSDRRPLSSFIEEVGNRKEVSVRARRATKRYVKLHGERKVFMEQLERDRKKHAANMKARAQKVAQRLLRLGRRGQ